jgi:hypothetical protein
VTARSGAGIAVSSTSGDEARRRSLLIGENDRCDAIGEAAPSPQRAAITGEGLPRRRSFQKCGSASSALAMRFSPLTAMAET